MKALQVKSVVIKISANSKIDCGFFCDLKIRAIFPGCRKEVSATYSPSAGKVWLQPMYGHNGRASVAPDDWRKIIDKASFVSCTIFPIEITEAMRAQAVADHCDRTLDSVERQRAQISRPDFEPERTPVIITA